MIKCKFCEKEITQDRYNLGIYWERQDLPGKSDWQKSAIHPQEDVCGTCFDLIDKYFGGLIHHLKQNKGKINP